MTQPETTNDDSGKLALTPPQSAAADLLVAGSSVTDAAESIRVARQPVSGWMHNNCVFQAALNRRREEPWPRVTDRLCALLPKSTALLERKMNQGRAAVGRAARHQRVPFLRQSAADWIGNPDELNQAARKRVSANFLRNLTSI